MKAKINIELILKDGKKLKLNYDDGLELYNELRKIFKKVETIIYPIYPTYPYEPFKITYWNTINELPVLMTCNSGEVLT